MILYRLTAARSSMQLFKVQLEEDGPEGPHFLADLLLKSKAKRPTTGEDDGAAPQTV